MKAHTKSIHLFWRLFLSLTFSAGLFFSLPAQRIHAVGATLYVAPGGQTSGACDSWANACELGYALTSAVSGQELWVAAGRYTPTSGTNRSLSFNLKTGVALYGGFAGTETARTDRDPASNVTTLSGDLNGDDVGFTNNGENSNRSQMWK